MNAITMIGLAMLVASPSLAQTPTTPANPTKVEFTASTDHALLTKYTIGYFLPGATDPVQTADLALGVPDAQQKVTEPINAMPLGFGAYTARLKAVAGAVSSEWSTASNEFTRAPFPPGVVRVVK